MDVICTYGEDIQIGAFKFPNAKKPRLCIQTGNKIVQYGIFNNDESAKLFMDELGDFVGAIIEKEKNK